MPVLSIFPAYSESPHLRAVGTAQAAAGAALCIAAAAGRARARTNHNKQGVLVLVLVLVRIRTSASTTCHDTVESRSISTVSCGHADVEQ